MTVGLECCIFATNSPKQDPACMCTSHNLADVDTIIAVRSLATWNPCARRILVPRRRGISSNIQSEPLLLFFLAYATHPASAMTKKNKKNEMLHMTTTSKRISRNHYATVVVLSGFSEATEHIGTQQTILCLKCRTRERRVPLAGRYLFKDDLRKRKQLSD